MLVDVLVGCVAVIVGVSEGVGVRVLVDVAVAVAVHVGVGVPVSVGVGVRVGSKAAVAVNPQQPTIAKIRPRTPTTKKGLGGLIVLPSRPVALLQRVERQCQRNTQASSDWNAKL